MRQLPIACDIGKIPLDKRDIIVTAATPVALAVNLNGRTK